ncbi:MAG: class I SAM-dependent methyltransferase [Lachnospiraceae bacterium]|nr:class I SAM-dependent methyltransferase [Lachnospiraceae bacterium]
MVDKSEVISFFDRLAPEWDDNMVTNDVVINTILDNAGVKGGSDVLDVACGTGVLFPYYQSRNVGSLTAVDISPKMIERAKEKYKDTDIDIICADVETYEFGKLFDNIVVYNAFPHFRDADALISILFKKLKPGGMLTIAHGMSRDKINSHHKGTATKVSNGLMEAEELAEVFRKYLTVQTVISDDSMYQVAGCRIK